MKLRIYLSSDEDISPQDTEIGVETLTLARGLRSISVTTTLPADLVPGTHYVGVCDGDQCSAGRKLVIRGVELIVFGISRGKARLGGSIELSVFVYCHGDENCAAPLVDFYRVMENEGISVEILIDSVVPEEDIASETALNITLTELVDYGADEGSADYYACIGALCTPRITLPITRDGDDIPDELDVDDDGDGLIEIATADELNNVRYVLDGSGYMVNATAPKDTTGCPSEGCSGYELTADIDLTPYGRTHRNGFGWVPLGLRFEGGESPLKVTGADSFTALFDGNNFTISNLYIRDTDNFFTNTEEAYGLFARLGGTARLRYLSLRDVNIFSRTSHIGGLAGGTQSGATILSSSVTGQLEAPFISGGSVGAGGLVGQGNGVNIIASYMTGSLEIGRAGSLVGGLIGEGDNARITASYAVVTVSGRGQAGGLLGEGNGATITASYVMATVSNPSVCFCAQGGVVGRNSNLNVSNSYAIGTVSGNRIGGLLGENIPGAASPRAVTASYWDSEVSGITTSTHGAPQTTTALQSPLTTTGIYAAWEGKCPNDPSMDIWDFGTAAEYPALNCTPDGPIAQPRTWQEAMDDFLN